MQTSDIQQLSLAVADVAVSKTRYHVEMLGVYCIPHIPMKCVMTLSWRECHYVQHCANVHLSHVTLWHYRHPKTHS